MQIKPEDVKNLRDATGAGMMNCKKALLECSGDFEKAVEILRQSGLAKAVKKLDRDAKEGVVFSYIHPGDKIGVLLELNCETDFVAKTDEFKKLAKELALQIAATTPVSVTKESIPQEVIDHERTLYESQAIESGKPEAIAKKIADGKIEKWAEEACLMEQNWIKDPNRKIKDIIMDLISKVGENIRVKRFSRFQIGQG